MAHDTPWYWKTIIIVLVILYDIKYSVIKELKKLLNWFRSLFRKTPKVY